MAYTRKNFRTKKELIGAFKEGAPIEVFQPRPFGPAVKDGTTTLEGPHFPEPHRWYAQATVKDGLVVKVS